MAKSPTSMMPSRGRNRARDDMTHQPVAGHGAARELSRATGCSVAAAHQATCLASVRICRISDVMPDFWRHIRPGKASKVLNEA